MNQLLSAYASDDSDESASDTHPHVASRSSNASNVFRKLSSIQTNSSTGRAKRIIGLNAILPRDISDQLTRSSVQGTARTTADYSSDESSDELPTASRPRPRSEQNHSSIRRATDRCLENFLTELHALQPGNTNKEKRGPGSSIHIIEKKIPESLDANPSKNFRNATETIPTRFNYNNRATNSAPTISSQLETDPDSAEENTTFDVQQQGAPSLEHQLPHYKRRKELERELRRGNLSFIEENQEMHTLHQSLSEYRPTDSSSLMQQRTSTPIFRGPKPLLQTYLPKEGTTVAQSDLTSRQKSKHQIHSLVASAVTLQAKRNQEASILPIKGTSNTRSDAKRKYGW